MEAGNEDDHFSTSDKMEHPLQYIDHLSLKVNNIMLQYVFCIISLCTIGTLGQSSAISTDMFYTTPSINNYGVNIFDNISSTSSTIE